MNVKVAFATLALALVCGCNRSVSTAPAQGPKPLTQVQKLTAEADSGKVPAILDLAKAYADGDGVARDGSRANSLLFNAAQLGSADALEILAGRMEDELLSSSDPQRWRSLVRDMATRGDPRAQVWAAGEFVDISIGAPGSSQLVQIRLAGKSVPDRAASLAKAVAWLEKSAAQGQAQAKTSLGLMHLYGIRGLESEPPHAFMPPDASEAITLLSEAAEAGEWRAQLVLANFFALNHPGIARDPARAMRWWDRLANQADPRISLAIGSYFDVKDWKSYAPGDRIWRNDALNFSQTNARALDWYGRAEHGGSALAAVRKAQILADGRAGAADPVQAFALWSKAGEAGLPEAKYSLGKAYAQGIGVQTDFARAHKYFLDVANGWSGRSPDAKNELGLMSENGRGTERNVLVAYAWFSLASAADSKDAKANLARLEKTMTRDGILKGLALASQWKPGQEMLVELGANESGRPTGAGGTPARVVATATGIVVNSNLVLTNNHVAAACSLLLLPAADKTAKIVAADSVNDLALLATDSPFPAYATFSGKESVRHGQEVAAFAYPSDGPARDSGQLVAGVVAALAGPGDKPSLFQMTAQVPRGGSGAGITDRKGHIVGMVAATGEASADPRAPGDVAKVFNLAVSAKTVKAFLDGGQVKYESEGDFLVPEKSPEELADAARKYSVRIECKR